jgi:hypothetical protein
MGELKIPARISMKQGDLKSQLEAVKDFAHSVEGMCFYFILFRFDYANKNLG